MTANSFDARNQLRVGDATYEVFRLDRIDGSARLPYSLKVLLENLLRNEDGKLVTAEQVSALGGWDPTAEANPEIQFTPARGVCCIGRARAVGVGVPEEAGWMLRPRAARPHLDRSAFAGSGSHPR